MPAIGASSQLTFAVEGLDAETRVARVEGEEGLSQLFQFHLLLVSDETDIQFSSVIGRPALLTLETDGSEPRHVHGIVSRFAHGETGKKHNAYRATLVPALWRLHHRHDSRIFQDLAVPAIVESVLKDAGITDYRLQLEGSYGSREYCVQYRESDHAFISRLLEEEGIHYFFEHHEDKHVLVLADGQGAHAPIAGASTLVYRPPLGAMAHGESVSRFVYAEEIRPGKVTLNDFNFKRPSLALTGTSQAKDDSDLEIYDFPGEYELPADGAALARIRLEERQSVRQVGEGDSGCIRLTPGCTFSLGQHPRDADNRGYLITRVQHRGAQAVMGEAAEAGADSYANSFQVIPDDVRYRPLRRTARPSVRGVQTAIVVGPSGEVIHTDEHGRVKVQFHWDRQGKRDDKSSCWIRVSQLWAGAGWGAMWIPRVGHEVIVDFIEGDPDRPIVVGRVYHGTNVPPYTLPSEKTKSTIKSDSPTGGGSNELRFEDKKGSEEIYLHAQKDWNVVVENDRNDEIGGDESLTVKGDVTEAVSGDRHIAIDGDKEEDVGGDHKHTVDGNHAITVSGDMKVSADGDHATQVTGAMKVTAGKSITIECGDVKVTIEKSGAVTVQAKELTLKSDGPVKIEGQKIALKSDATIAVEASGAIKVKGSGVDLN